MSDEPTRDAPAPKPVRDLRVGDLLPLVLSSTDLAHILNIDRATLWRWEQTNKLEGLELLPRLGNRRYSGKRVQQWLDEGLSDWALARSRPRAVR